MRPSNNPQENNFIADRRGGALFLNNNETFFLWWWCHRHPPSLSFLHYSTTTTNNQNHKKVLRQRRLCPTIVVAISIFFISWQIFCCFISSSSSSSSGWRIDDDDRSINTGRLVSSPSSWTLLQNRDDGDDDDDKNISTNDRLNNMITLVVTTTDPNRLVDVRDIVRVGSNHSLVEEVVVVVEDEVWSTTALVEQELNSFAGDTKKIRVISSVVESSNHGFDPTLFLEIRTGGVMLLQDDVTLIADTITCAYESWLFHNKSFIHTFGAEHRVYPDIPSKYKWRRESVVAADKNKASKEDSNVVASTIPNLFLSGLLLDTKLLNSYFHDPANAAIRKYLHHQQQTQQQQQEEEELPPVSCNDIALAMVATKHIGSNKLIWVPSPHGSRIDDNEIMWFHIDRKDIVKDKKTIDHFILGQHHHHHNSSNSKSSSPQHHQHHHWHNQLNERREKIRKECYQTLQQMLNHWSIQLDHHHHQQQQCSYSQRVEKPISGGITFTKK